VLQVILYTVAQTRMEKLQVYKEITMFDGCTLSAMECSTKKNKRAHDDLTNAFLCFSMIDDLFNSVIEVPDILAVTEAIQQVILGLDTPQGLCEQLHYKCRDCLKKFRGYGISGCSSFGATFQSYLLALRRQLCRGVNLQGLYEKVITVEEYVSYLCAGTPISRVHRETIIRELGPRLSVVPMEIQFVEMESTLKRTGVDLSSQLENGQMYPIKELKPVQVGLNDMGVTFSRIFKTCVDDSVTEIEITDPYVRNVNQQTLLFIICMLFGNRCRNLREIRIRTVKQNDRAHFDSLMRHAGISTCENPTNPRVKLIVEQFAKNEELHYREVRFNNGWVVEMDRGLDIYKDSYVMNPIKISFPDMTSHPCRAFKVTRKLYPKDDSTS